MTTKELIQRLQEADPTGNLPVTVGKLTITDAFSLPAYYDGTYEHVELNEDGDAVSGKYVREGHTIELYAMGIEDALWDYPDMVVDFTDLYKQHPDRAADKIAIIEEIRNQAKNFILDNKLVLD